MNFKLPVCLFDHFLSEVKNCSDGGHSEILAVAIGRTIETTLVVVELIYPPKDVFLNVDKGKFFN